MSRLFGALAAVGFLAAVVVHGRTFIPGTSTSGAAFLLHLGAFGVMIPTIFAIRSALGNAPGFHDMRSVLPLWAVPLFIMALVYAVANFAADLMLLQGGSPEIRDGHYVLMSHGKLIRDLTLEDYLTMQRYQMRLFSGHWMFFYLFPALYFLFGRESGRAIAAPSAQSSSPDSNN
jgi:hypothetical protein